MNEEVKKFLEFKATTLKRAAANEITIRMANTIIQPALTEYIRGSYLSKDLFLKEVLTSDRNRRQTDPAVIDRMNDQLDSLLGPKSVTKDNYNWDEDNHDEPDFDYMHDND